MKTRIFNMSAHYLICYDVSDAKRRRKVAKIVYALALGGQKSALETVLNPREVEDASQEIFTKIKVSEDRVNVIKVKPRAILLGRAKQLTYDEGAIII
ncbi:MAG: CRISPR-associated endonuclease Cas2 [Campylobacterota bacterium]|nr:CRISPR-associated endonuclease Cas2 [Campylobacterota bacterium]